MRPSFFRFRLASLLTLLLAYAGVLNASDYASVLSDADWHWQTRGDVTYGWASFTDLYGSPQRVSIAKYSNTMLGTSLFVKERSPQGTHSLAIEAGAKLYYQTLDMEVSLNNAAFFKRKRILYIKASGHLAPEVDVLAENIAADYGVLPYYHATLGNDLSLEGAVNPDIIGGINLSLNG